VDRVVADVAELARAPRDRRHPQERARARQYVTERLTEVGWQVAAVPFERRWVLGVSGAGGRHSILRRLRMFPRLTGVNLLADLPAAPGRPDPRAPSGRRLLLIAHLDSVTGSPGADDNASGVAALLECARLLATLPEPVPVRLAVVDLEELGKVGSTALAADREFVRGLSAVLCLESVGTFSSQPQTQQLGGLGLLFRGLARQVAANRNRGDFVLVVCRRSSLGLARALTAGGAGLVTPLSVLTARDPRADGLRGRLVTWGFPLLANLDRSDHAPFWNRRVPSLMLTTTAPFRNRHYHRPGDRPENVDHERLAALAAVVAAVAATHFPPP
jgi:Zn-dependent M28 family amino/carboxypeptidase